MAHLRRIRDFFLEMMFLKIKEFDKQPKFSVKKVGGVLAMN
jgi:hypothetical protein